MDWQIRSSPVQWNDRSSKPSLFSSYLILLLTFPFPNILSFIVKTNGAVDAQNVPLLFSPQHNVDSHANHCFSGCWDFSEVRRVNIALSNRRATTEFWQTPSEDDRGASLIQEGWEAPLALQVSGSYHGWCVLIEMVSETRHAKGHVGIKSGLGPGVARCTERGCWYHADSDYCCCV